jgi:hypothetical protein
MGDQKLMTYFDYVTDLETGKQVEVALEGDALADYLERLNNPPPPSFPNTISDRQFFQQLAVAGLISEDEAIDAVAIGQMPAAIGAFINALPSEQQFPAKMLLKGAVSFNRDHPLVEAFGAMQGMTSDQIDDLWRAAAAL